MIYGKEMHWYYGNFEWNTRETGKSGYPIIYWWNWMKYKWLQWYIWKENPSLYWWHWMKHQGNRESNHILISMIYGKEMHWYFCNIEWNTRETGKSGNPIIYCWYWMKFEWLQWYMQRKCIDIMVTLNETSGKHWIQSYIADIQWNISEYNDLVKGNPSIYWCHWMKHQGNRKSNHILMILNEI